ncbi:YjeF-related protein N-terminus-domain-containing protein [Plectosphaerella plurivora]|uniref:Enhancer of mRNA-decapping protein 3 n=1 Tax=Plectosphaerella plurivora TaxID=936078 RepID=A0A9P8VCD9_9PEZI|nr:YjeF-related protein N-terminus-domain-containing protein [Plectosphaerella plurivora]
MDFIGLQMMVTLRNPSGVQLKGTVSEVTPGASLVLSNVFHLGTDKWIPRLTLEPGNIADVAEYKEQSPPTFAAPAMPPAPAAVPAPAPVAQPPQSGFVDPAILSLGKRPTPVSRTSSAARVHTIPSHPVELPGLQPVSQPVPQHVPQSGPQPGQPGVLPMGSVTGAPRTETPTSILTSNIQEMHVDDDSPSANKAPIAPINPETPTTATKKRNRKSKQQRASKIGLQEEPIFEGSPSQSGQGGRGKGWRQTPILQSTASFQPFKALKQSAKKGTLDNGWASEDVTEEMGEFDFEGGLAKFDKRSIFDQMQKDDKVSEADRLVGHNRLAKPGTAGGKNLHHTENVLDRPPTIPKTAHDFWNSEADDAINGGERLSGRDVRSAQSMRRTDSKPGAKRSQSRKASASGMQPITRTHSAQGHQPGFYLQPSGIRAEPVSALQMLNLENIAANEIGLSEDVMAENAGRGIAQVVLMALKDPAIQVRLGRGGANHQTTPSTSPTVVILAGNNKSGVRAVAAARHLRNKNVQLLVCVVGIERERDLLEDMRQQIRVFKNLGGRVYTKIDLFDHLRKASHTSSPASSVTLIVDALLGLAISFEELRTGDQTTVYELIEWANRNEAFTLAVDVPTGIDPSTGKVSIIDGGRLYVKPRYIVAMGAPKRGLLEAMAPPLDDGLENGAHSSPLAEDDDWKLFIADIGLGAAVWKKAGTKLRRGIDFDDQWVLEMRYRGGETEDDADY